MFCMGIWKHWWKNWRRVSKLSKKGFKKIQAHAQRCKLGTSPATDDMLWLNGRNALLILKTELATEWKKVRFISQFASNIEFVLLSLNFIFRCLKIFWFNSLVRLTLDCFSMYLDFRNSSHLRKWRQGPWVLGSSGALKLTYGIKCLLGYMATNKINAFSFGPFVHCANCPILTVCFQKN